MSKVQLAYAHSSDSADDLDTMPAGAESSSLAFEQWDKAPQPEESAHTVSFDAESLFSASLSKTTLLSRDEEIALTQDIARSRTKIQRILRQARRLSKAALSDAGRGVVLPEDSFREREAIAILAFAEAHLKEARPMHATGLTRPNLRKFVTALSAALTEYRGLRDRMVRSNVRLVSSIARQYHHPTLTFLDFVQEGTLGLLRAIEKYEPGRMVKFSTYAAWWIWQQIARSADTQGSLIRTPVHWNQLRRHVSREAGATADDEAGGSADEDLAHTQGIDPARMAMMTQAFRFVSLDSPIDEDDDRPLETMIAADDPEPQEQLLDNDLRARLEEAITHLPPREAAIVRQRFGMEGEEEQTLGEIGQQLGVSRERVRQLESRALKQLRAVCAAHDLQDYLH